jgi:hypothetical protein
MSGTLAADLGGGSPLPTIFPAVAPVQPPAEARGEAAAAAVGLERAGWGKKVAMGKKGRSAPGKEKKKKRTVFSL